MLKKWWNNKRKSQNKKSSLDVEEENNFLYELLTDDNLNNYDLKLKISRMNLLFDLQKILYNKQINETNYCLDKQIDDLIIWEEESKKIIKEYADNKNTSAKSELQKLISESDNLLFKKNSLQKEIEDLSNNIKEKQKQIVELDDEILYQNFGLYTPVYDLMNSSEYKERIKLCRDKQKQMIKNKSAAICETKWTVNNSIREGQKMTNRNIKLLLRCFNNECDYLISKVKYNNISSIEDRLYKSFNLLNQINEVNLIEITSGYFDLKIEELYLCYEYEEKKYQEKEEAREIREQEREQAKLLKEIEEERIKISKEQEHYNTYLKHINEQIEIENNQTRLQLLIEKRNLATQNLEELDKALKDIDYREANQKAGYVYIISNIGAFGENVYKIGMTRRLNPQERIDELGGASVPFKFDIHAMIFSDNAPALEAALHRAFENKKVNMSNNRKEFFNVTLEEIKAVVETNFDKTVDFIDIPSAQQYRETLKMKQKFNITK